LHVAFSLTNHGGNYIQALFGSEGFFVDTHGIRFMRLLSCYCFQRHKHKIVYTINQNILKPLFFHSNGLFNTYKTGL